MAAKVHKSLRLDSDLVKRVNELKYESEPLSNAMTRIMGVGCDTLEGIARDDTIAHERIRAGHGQFNDENTQKLISLLEKDIERLNSEHERDLERIREKDELIAKSLSKVYDLADQAQIIAGMAHETKQLPASDEGGDIVDVNPIPKRITFSEWFKHYRPGARRGE